jgi:hypothetical protein
MLQAREACQECRRTVQTVLQRYYKSVTRVWQACYKYVTEDAAGNGDMPGTRTDNTNIGVMLYSIPRMLQARGTFQECRQITRTCVSVGASTLVLQCVPWVFSQTAHTYVCVATLSLVLHRALIFHLHSAWWRDEVYFPGLSKSITKVLKDAYKGATTCYNDMTRMLQGCYMDVTTM